MVDVSTSSFRPPSVWVWNEGGVADLSDDLLALEGLCPLHRLGAHQHVVQRLAVRTH